MDDVLVPLYHEHVHKNVRCDASLVAHLYIKYTNIRTAAFIRLFTNKLYGGKSIVNGL